MLTMTVNAVDLASLHELHHAALGGRMFYAKPYRAFRQAMGAEGTLLTVTGHSLVACTMATRNRIITHARIPCTNVDNNDDALFALQAPEDFERLLRRYGDKSLALTLNGSRLEIVLPRPGNVRGTIWLPMERVNGRMLSVVCQEPATTVPIKVDVLLAALRRVPRGQAWDLLAIQLSDAGVDLRYVVNGTTYEQQYATKVERNYAGDPLLCSTRRVARFVRVLQSLRKRGRAIQAQMSSSRIAIWNDAVTVQFFADRHPNEWVQQSIPNPTEDVLEIRLSLHRPNSDFLKDVGKWLRRLVRNALAKCESVDTTWLLSRKLAVAEVTGGIQTSFEIRCVCDSWPLEADQVRLSANPLTTAAILDCVEEDARGCRLTYRDGLLRVQAGSRPYQLTARVERVSLQGIDGKSTAGAFRC